MENAELDAIKSAYPDQYYATVSAGAVDQLIDAWASQKTNGLPLPAASGMIVVTSDQWGLAQVPSYSGSLKISVSGTTIQYPARFYCDKNTPCSVFDMWGYSNVTSATAIGDLYAITPAQYADRLLNPRNQYYNAATGQLADYVPPPVVIPLKTQAASAMVWIQQQANLASAMGQVFTADMKAYVKAIAAIANGTDTTSTALPERPIDILAS
ncbi:MAG: hypothetical protein ABF636_10340 [Acetobacter sp.]|uniref:hypothetical protein n=1 Tax=Acetobacter sp. TaxID=440 RepID=UPI0039EC9DCB